MTRVDDSTLQADGTYLAEPTPPALPDGTVPTLARIEYSVQLNR